MCFEAIGRINCIPLSDIAVRKPLTGLDQLQKPSIISFVTDRNKDFDEKIPYKNLFKLDVQLLSFSILIRPPIIIILYFEFLASQR